MSGYGERLNAILDRANQQDEALVASPQGAVLFAEEELSDNPEMAAYRTAVAVDKQACTDFQAKLDGTADRGVFADVPWIPGELKVVVEAALGCAGWPENPENMFRPSPVSSP